MATMTVGMNGMGTRSRAELIADRNRELFNRQRATKRPISEVFFTKHIDNSRIVKADDPERRREMRIFSAVMSVLFALCMVYVWQHFSAIEMGYRIEAQKHQVEDLREQNRQMRLTEAQLTEPGRIDHMARQLGLDQPAPGQVIRMNAIVSPDRAPAMAALAGPSTNIE